MRRPACLGWSTTPPSQDTDLEARVEQHQVDGGLERRDRGIVLGVQVAQVAQLDHAGLALAGDVRHAQVGLAARPEVGQPLDRRGRGPPHRMDQVGAGARVIEDFRQEDALIQLDARVLVHLGVAPLGQDRGSRGHQPGIAVGRGVAQLVDPEALLEIAGELRIDDPRIRAQERESREAQRLTHAARRRPLLGGPGGPGRQTTHESLAALHVCAQCIGVAGERGVRGLARRRERERS